MTPRLRNQALKIFAFAALMPSLMGYACGGSSGSELPQGTIAFDFETWNAQSGKPLQVAIRVRTSHEFHAFELDIQAEPGQLEIHSVVPGAQFDDNGTLFVAPEYNFLGDDVKNIVDFRHGTASAAGPITIAEFTLHPNNPTPETYISFSRVQIVDINGVELNITPLTSTFEVQP